MNNKSRLFWEDYWKEKSEKAPADAFVSAWAFGSDPDHLLDLVKQGKKQPLVLDICFMKRNRKAASTTWTICGHFGQPGRAKSHH